MGCGGVGDETEESRQMTGGTGDGTSDDGEGKLDFDYMSVRQLELHRALGKSPRLAQMFAGGLDAYKRNANLDAMSQSAHSFRELCEKVPIDFGVPKARDYSLTAEVTRLNENWGTAIRNSKCHSEGTWLGEIDHHLSRFIAKLQAFLESFQKAKPGRRVEMSAFLDCMSGSITPLPDQIKDNHVKRWFECRAYFQAVAHHNKAAVRSEFEDQLDFLERFLIDQIAPKTTADRAVIDSIIKRGEGRG
jgi:hypothetical protein